MQIVFKLFKNCLLYKNIVKKLTHTFENIFLETDCCFCFRL